MGAMTNNLEYFVNTILDIVTIKTGIVISEERLVDILNKSFPNDKTFVNYKKRRNDLVRIRSDEFELICWEVRKALGELEETRQLPLLGNSKRLLEFKNQGYDPIKIINSIIDIFADLHNPENPKYLDPNVVFDIAISRKIAPAPIIYEMLTIIAKNQNVSNTISPVEQLNWDGGTNLDDLFNKEALPKKANEYIEQKFINYLQANPDMLEFMHWRNFERLVAEFFRRQDFIVELGPGSNDGGVDLRIYNKKDDTQPYIIIQCKRHKKSNEVKIETVKSFYTDVDYEGAKKGIIATTSRIAKGGKNVSTLRKYPLEFAENNEIKIWVDKMKHR
jgi:restriction system protein